MNYIGKWGFDSIGTLDDEKGMIYLNADEYLASPMPYIDETDEEAVANEMDERKKTIGMQVKICDDGKLYFLIPVPDGVSEAELKAVLNTGELMLIDGMLTDRAIPWEERDGELWYDTGIGDDSWAKAIDENGFFTIITMRFKKID